MLLNCLVVMLCLQSGPRTLREMGGNDRGVDVRLSRIRNSMQIWRRSRDSMGYATAFNVRRLMNNKASCHQFFEGYRVIL